MTIKSVKTMRGANKKALNATKLKDKDNVTSDIEAATEGVQSSSCKEFDNSLV